MTAAALSHPGTLSGGGPGHPARRHLRPVPERARPVQGARPRQVADSRSCGAVRLTRRGRLAVTLSTLAVIALLPAILLTLVAPADAGGEVIVRSGQTLSQLAAAHLPEMAPDQAIVAIQRANGLSSSQVQTGQVLQIPSP